MIVIDSREKSELCDLIRQSKFETKTEMMKAGDYFLQGKKESWLIEVSTVNDFCGKIISRRLWKQSNRCKEVCDNVMFMLVGRWNTLMVRRLSANSIFGAEFSLMRQGVIVHKVGTFQKAYENIVRMANKIESEGTSYQEYYRPTPKQYSPYEQALFMLCGIRGVGQQKAISLLKDRNMYELFEAAKNGEKSLGEFDRVFKARSS